VLLSADEDKVKREIVQYVHICSAKIDGAEGWNKNISYLQTEGREIQ